MTITLLHWFLVSTLAMAACLALRQLTRGRLSHRARYALWLPVLIRLLFPRFLGQSPVSALHLLTLAESSASETAMETPAALNRWATPVSSPLSWLPLVWAAGVALVLFCLLASNLRFRSRLTKARQPFEGENCPLPLYRVDGLASPLLLGLLRPAIYLPQTMGEGALPYALAHELTHWRHGDQVWNLLRSLALALHWYNPLAWLCLSACRLDGELACDEGTLARLGAEQRLDYGRALTDLASQAQKGPLWGSAMVSRQSWLALRIQALLRPSKNHPQTLLCCAAALVLLMPVLFWDSGQQLTPQQALNQLADSLSYKQGGITFTLPQGYQPPEDWNIHVAGRVVYPDGFSRSVHFFDSENQTHSWQPGQRYMIALDDPGSCVDLTMDVWLPDGKGGQCYLSIDLLATDTLQTS